MNIVLITLPEFYSFVFLSLLSLKRTVSEQFFSHFSFSGAICNFSYAVCNARQIKLTLTLIFVSALKNKNGTSSIPVLIILFLLLALLR